MDPDRLIRKPTAARKALSPFLFTATAFIAAILASRRENQKPISRNEQSPIPSQPRKKRAKLSEKTSISMKKVKKLR